ncbi:YggT family protein [Candidatus Margulisiibacteriota bacterium]
MDFVVFVINFLFSVGYILLAVRAVLPWIPHSKNLLSPVYFLTDPVLSVIRKGLPPLRIGLDAAPFILIILLWVVQRLILLALL